MATEIEKIRVRLETERRRLQDEIGELQTKVESSEARREGSPFGKREEEATESFELEKRLALEKQVKANLADVEHALEKVSKGTYGVCDVCGQKIPAERLEAMPHANLCMTCKAKYAKTRLPPV